MRKAFCKVGIFILTFIAICVISTIIPNPITMGIGVIIVVYWCCLGISKLQKISQLNNSNSRAKQGIKLQGVTTDITQVIEHKEQHESVNKTKRITEISRRWKKLVEKIAKMNLMS